MIILGIDPGYAIVGYGALRFERGQYRAIGFGAITTEAGMDFSARLQYIYDNMMEMIRQCRPDAVAIEKLYFHTNQKTVIHVAEARGIILLAAQKSGVPIFEYTPLQVKTAVTGYGRAHKPQVMEMTTRLLKLRKFQSLMIPPTHWLWLSATLMRPAPDSGIKCFRKEEDKVDAVSVTRKFNSHRVPPLR